MSKKADLLGKSASFARAQPVSSRRAAIAAATGAPTEGVEPPRKVPRDQLAHNPANPRDELTELEELAASLREKGQLQSLAVVTRHAFLASHPGKEESLASAKYVVVDGNRRLAAAGIAELDELRIDVNDDLAASDADTLESALIANIHRVDVPPLEQAKAIQTLLDKHGTQAEVARRLGKTEAWVSQRLALLKLAPELQEKVETGELKVEPARKIGRMSKEKQKAAAEEALNAVKAPRRQRRRKGENPDAAAAEGLNAVKSMPETAAPPVADSGLNAVKAEVPAQHSGSASEVFTVPAGPPEAIVDALADRLSPADLAAVVNLLANRVDAAAGG